MSWRKYISTMFVNPEGRIKTRDRIPFECPQCGKISVRYVQNVRQRVEKYGNYLCRSCMGKLLHPKKEKK